jgi:hypothetical protein
MKTTKIAVIVATAVLGLGALAGAAVKANASSAPVTSAPSPVTAVDQSTTAEPAEADAGLPDTDQVQEQVGDQNAADDATEASGESKAKADGPGGHADDPADANADHQFEGVE